MELLLAHFFATIRSETLDIRALTDSIQHRYFGELHFNQSTPLRFTGKTQTET